MLAIDLSRICSVLQERFGLALRHEYATFDGGRFPVIRPVDLEEGNGFVISLARTPRQVEASFRADQFAGALLRQMSQADAEQRGGFHTLREQACSDGAAVYVAIDGMRVDQLPETAETWRKLEVEVARRLGPDKITEVSVNLRALEAASTCLSLATVLLPLETTPNGSEFDRGLPEGARTRIEVNRYERSPANRAACIAHYGLECRGCGLRFEDVYGELGAGYIQVHHRVPVSKLGHNYIVNPVTDLVPVCANCHAMLHRTDPPGNVEALRGTLRARGQAATST